MKGQGTIPGFTRELSTGASTACPQSNASYPQDDVMAASIRRMVEDLRTYVKAVERQDDLRARLATQTKTVNKQWDEVMRSWAIVEAQDDDPA
jgi:hypothetical protein